MGNLHEGGSERGLYHITMSVLILRTEWKMNSDKSSIKVKQDISSQTYGCSLFSIW